MRRHAWTAAAALALVAAAGSTALAGLKKETYSTGSFATDVPDLDVVDAPLSVKSRGRVKDINIAVRIDHSYISDLQLTLISPRGQVVKLSTNNGGDADGYGGGPQSCGGQMLTFDDESGEAIFQAQAKDLDPSPEVTDNRLVGRYQPETPLQAVDGSRTRGTWHLLVADGGLQDSGTLFCWQATIKSKLEKKRQR